MLGVARRSDQSDPCREDGTRCGRHSRNSTATRCYRWGLTAEPLGAVAQVAPSYPTIRFQARAGASEHRWARPLATPAEDGGTATASCTADEAHGGVRAQRACRQISPDYSS